jgi:hypothetical protein
MTAEIAIVNRQAIALAADSAITVGRERVWKYANKLFSLGPRHDIGVMIYNAGEFLGIPWDVIIKQFRTSCHDLAFGTVEDCATAFLSFLRQANFSDEQTADISIAGVILDILTDFENDLKYNSKSQMLSEIERQAKRSSEAVLTIDQIDPFLEKGVFHKKYKSNVKLLSRDVFKYRPDDRHLDILVDFVYSIISRKIESAYHSGVVFAGFGGKEYLPSLLHYIVDGKNDDIVRFWAEERINLASDESSSSYIRPFGQSDIAFLFVEGMIHQYNTFLATAIREILREILKEKSRQLTADYIHDADERVVETARQEKDNKLIVDSLIDGFNRYRQDELVQPLMKVVTSLPKEEMASLAHSIVELTSLRRKIDSHLDTVGGPIDVAVISKGDGFVWIKRKHYFNVEMNRDFLYRKEAQIRGGNGESENDSRRGDPKASGQSN